VRSLATRSTSVSIQTLLPRIIASVMRPCSDDDIADRASHGAFVAHAATGRLRFRLRSDIQCHIARITPGCTCRHSRSAACDLADRVGPQHGHEFLAGIGEHHVIQRFDERSRECKWASRAWRVACKLAMTIRSRRLCLRRPHDHENRVRARE